METALQPAAIIFDCGGTLIHPDLRPVARALAEKGIAVGAETNLAESLARAADMDKWHLPDLTQGSPFFEIWSLLSGIVDPRGPEALLTICEGRNVFTSLDEEARETFMSLKARGVRVGVLANDDGELPRELQEYGLAPYVDAFGSSQILGVSKPDPRAFHWIAHELKVDTFACWFVGDSIVNDYLGAIDAGFGAAFMYDRFGALRNFSVRRIARLHDIVDRYDEAARER